MSRYTRSISFVFEHGNPNGFMYSVGLHDKGKYELFALDLPVTIHEDVARMINFLSERSYGPNQTAQTQSWLLLKLNAVDADRSAQLMNSHLLQMDRNAKILEVTHISGAWPIMCIPCDAPECRCSTCGKVA